MRKYNWKYFIITVIICGFIGALVGGGIRILLNTSIASSFVLNVKNFMPFLYVISTISGIISLISFCYFNYKLKAENYCDDENSYYDKFETSINIAINFATICGIINFTAFGVNIFEQTKLSVLFLINAALCFIGEVLFISLVKKIRPELNADPLEKNFKKNYFDKLDEFEKYKIGKASYNTMTFMTPVYVILFCISYAASLVFNISSVICIPIGVIWFIQTIMFTYFSIKKTKNKKYQG